MGVSITISDVDIVLIGFFVLFFIGFIPFYAIAEWIKRRRSVA